LSTCGVSGGSAYCWGDNRLGELADPRPLRATSPTQVSGNHAFASLIAGDKHVCGLTAAGAAWCWGGMGWGTNGDGSDSTATVPVPVSGQHVFTALYRGSNSVCGLD